MDTGSLKETAVKTKKRVLRPIVAAFLFIFFVPPLLSMSAAQIAGRGYSFTAAAAEIQMHRFLKYLQKGSYGEAAELIGFSDETAQSEEERQKAYADGLTALFGDNLFIKDIYKSNVYSRYQNVVLGDVAISVFYDDTNTRCTFGIFFYFQNGRLLPESVSPDSYDEKTNALAETFSKAIATHDPEFEDG